MGFLSDILDLCDKAAQQVANEKRVSEWNRMTGTTTEERLSELDNYDLFCLLYAPSSSGIAWRERSVAKSLLKERGFSDYWYDSSEYHIKRLKEEESQFLQGTYTYREYSEKKDGWKGLH